MPLSPIATAWQILARVWSFTSRDRLKFLR
jgi:hypothetical protein